mmetsp:Transcript_22899/g.74601  ORF Transcript_22899/g.74601 Transcript_22899/m.74601 type:complete len:291 (+) Transcript_22899:1814-2686(+)
MSASSTNPPSSAPSASWEANRRSRESSRKRWRCVAANRGQRRPRLRRRGRRRSARRRLWFGGSNLTLGAGASSPRARTRSAARTGSRLRSRSRRRRWRVHAQGRRSASAPPSTAPTSTSPHTTSRRHEHAEEETKKGAAEDRAIRGKCMRRARFCRASRVQFVFHIIVALRRSSLKATEASAPAHHHWCPLSNSAASYPKWLAKRSMSAAVTCSNGGALSRPSSAASDVTSRSASPHGTIPRNIERSGSTLNASPCRLTPCETCTPTAPILRSPTHTPVIPGTRPRACTP